LALARGDLGVSAAAATAAMTVVPKTHVADVAIAQLAAAAVAEAQHRPGVARTLIDSTIELLAGTTLRVLRVLRDRAERQRDHRLTRARDVV
jgi:hypothetical protein